MPPRAKRLELIGTWGLQRRGERKQAQIIYPASVNIWVINNPEI